jgi:hypothetical protein
MKNSERKLLEARLLTGVKKVISNQHAVLTKKTEKAIQKILKQLAKKAYQKGGGLATTAKADLNPEKFKLATVVQAPLEKRKKSK